ncbi:hypothetical protein HALO156_30173 [Halomonas sp. 156]|nr:hypothetical protein HALO156_30173 [Halomonas sp. 156]
MAYICIVCFYLPDVARLSKDKFPHGMPTKVAFANSGHQSILKVYTKNI